MSKGIKRQVGGVYKRTLRRSHFCADRQLRALLARHHFDLVKLMHTPRDMKALCGMFRAKITNRMSERVFYRVSGLVLDFPVEKLETAEASFCLLELIHDLAHKADTLNRARAYKLRQKKNRVISRLLLEMREQVVVGHDPSGREGFKTVISSKVFPELAYHFPSDILTYHDSFEG